MKKRIPFVLVPCFMLAACNQTIPEVELPVSVPEVKITNFSQALRDLGMMSEIYDSGLIRIQSNDIGDVTGAAQSTGSEIPRDITEMTKSTLNSIGGNILYIPYDPLFVQSQMATGYSNFDDKIIPDVVITGGITEFDRGLETKGKSTEIDVSTTLNDESIGGGYNDQDKSGLARITLDFNMLNFQTMAGIPRMNAVNSMKVHKAQGETGFAITLFGLTFGSKGELKRVQGRHDAVRMLVELSIIQMVGKYAGLPYWRLLGEGAKPDVDVLQTVNLFYYNLDSAQRIENAQEWLFLHGYDAPFTGVLDAKTHSLLQTFDSDHDVSRNEISLGTFQRLYLELPVTYDALSRRNNIAARYERFSNSAVAQVDLPPTPAPAPAPTGGGVVTQDVEMALQLSSNKRSYNVGDEVVLSVKTNKNGFVRCYYKDGSGLIAQIYPTIFQPRIQVTGNRKFSIPNPQVVGDNFAIELSTSNVKESFVCLASESNFPSAVGSAFLGQGLEALNVRSLDAIVRSFRQVLGENVSVSMLDIHVN